MIVNDTTPTLHFSDRDGSPVVSFVQLNTGIAIEDITMKTAIYITTEEAQALRTWIGPPVSSGDDTPEWWAYSPPPSGLAGDIPFWIHDGHGRRIADVRDQGASTEANARMLAAAPRMLSAMKAVLDDPEALRDGLTMDQIEGLNAAVAEAEGRA